MVKSKQKYEIFTITLKLLQGFYIFYLRIFIPATLTSLIVAATNLVLGANHFMDTFSFAYLFIAPAFQFVLYDFRDPGQYYFYNNIGFTRAKLWVLNICLSIFIFITLSAI